ncbi:BAG family molecular chaperone regulator 1-like [Quercus robur]|uniref:BAG family molecular chaperone regulator 1-like n=1 Tax=Quercus robur TaxID=38942 RepID=UPI00216268A4|nr:BAG family molecular chaperone regulator 1-like [Quercus robur]
MKPMKTKNIDSMFSNSVGGGGNQNVEEWEIRPGGMLVQKRDMNQGTVSIPTIKVRVKYGSLCHEIQISSQASFGNLKKMLAELTGLHPLDQKLIYKNKERVSKAYLDAARVKDGSKIELVEDIVSRERRCVEMLKNSKVEKASKSLAEISLEVDKIAGQVTALEAKVSRGGKVTKMDVESLTEMLMTKLVKLDEIVNVEGDFKLQRKAQVSRVQKHIETLDKMKLHYSKPGSSGGNIPWQQQQANSSKQMSVPMQKHHVQMRQMESKGQMQGLQQQQPLRHSESFVVTTQWETFE